MKRFTATLALVLALAVPGTAGAGEKWDQIKDTWEERPWAIILAVPAFIVTAPFMLVKDWLDSLGEGADEDED